MISDRLRALTLALEQALRTESWDEASTLLAQRDDLLQTLEVAGLHLEDELYLDLKRAEQDMLSALNEMRQGILESIRKSQRGSELLQTYALGSGNAALDQAS